MGCSILLLLVSAFSLAQRIRGFYDANAKPSFSFYPIGAESFDFAGRPVSLVSEIDDAGEGRVLLNYGELSLPLQVRVPQPLPFPGLARHASWLKVMLFAESTGMAYDDFEDGIRSGDIGTRLVVVTRNPFGAEPRKEGFGLKTDQGWGWGEVRRDLTTFTFHELKPEGTIDTHTLRFPESGNAFYRRQVRADQAGEPAPSRHDDELEEGTWEFQAALPLMTRPPGITKEYQALRASGWTLPVASLAVIGLMASLAIAFAPSRTRTDARSPRAA